MEGDVKPSPQPYSVLSFPTLNDAWHVPILPTAPPTFSFLRLVWRKQAFYRSFPTTLFMNIPYGCVMVAANESLKRALRPAGDYDTQTFLLAGSGAGAVAAAATNPLDVVKTRLQTQALRAPAPSAAAAVAGAKGEGIAVGTRGGIALPQFLRASGSGAAAGGGGGGAAGQHGPVLGGVQGTGIHSAAARCATGRCGAEKPVVTLQYQGLLDAVSLSTFWAGQGLSPLRIIFFFFTFLSGVHLRRLSSLATHPFRRAGSTMSFVWPVRFRL